MKIANLFGRNGNNKEPSDELLKPGTVAPSFSLAATKGETVSLNEFRGQPVVLVFYPEDGTSVCSSQLTLYNEALHLFEKHEAQILGISVDDAASHENFAQSLKLKFPLLSDDNPSGDVANRYGVLAQKDGKSERALYVVDPEGIIRWSSVSPRGVNPGAHGILEALESLSGGSL